MAPFSPVVRQMLAVMTAVLAIAASPFSAISCKAEEMTFTMQGNGGNCVGCGWTQADGEITGATASKLKAFYMKEQPGPFLQLNSPGGSLTGGLALGEAIRSLGMRTSVATSQPDGFGWETPAPGKCFSACAFAFLGGVDRSVDTASQLGFHQFYDPSALVSPGRKVFSALDLSDDQLLQGLVLEYVTEMGVDAKVAVLASETPPTSMHVMSPTELRDLHVEWSPNEFLPWKIEAYHSGLVAFSKSQDGAKTVTLYCTKGVRKVLFAEDRTSATTPPIIDLDTYTKAMPLVVLGAEVSQSQIAATASQKGYSLTFNLGRKFTPILDPNQAGIESNFVPHAYYFNMPLSTDGLKQAAALAFRNCV